MTIQVSCPDCGMAYEVPDDKAGKKFRCKQCETIVSIPDTDPPPVRGGGWDDNDDDYGDDRGIPNPVSRRRSGSSRSSRRRRSRSSDGGETVAPAIAMYVVAGLSIVGWILVMLSMLVVEPDNGMPQAEHEQMVTFYVVSGFVNLFLDGFILYGAYNLQTRQSKIVAMIAAILCCVPCFSPCCVVGIPFGIWALVAISNDPDFN